MGRVRKEEEINDKRKEKSKQELEKRDKTLEKNP
jgi:hypothetical protein